MNTAGQADPAPPDFSVIVPAYNEEAELPRSLAALRLAMERAARQGLSGELIVVDNNSADRTADVARAAGARVVFEPVNQISRARNAGARAAAGQYLVFTDADTVVSPELLAAALGNLASGRAAGGGAAMDFDSYPRRGTRTAIRLWNRLARWRGLAAGAFVYCLREGFEAVGGFSEKVYAGEEIFFSRSLRLWGRRRGLAFEVIATHPAVTSSRKLRWHSWPTIILYSLGLAIFPAGLLSRRLCAFWYRRPEGGSGS
ncbi:MAG TPA: glycosyltransferase [Planctomycetota bacterium]|nr:glycosyltransferase [Planctomycetota bacterium]